MYKSQPPNGQSQVDQLSKEGQRMGEADPVSHVMNQINRDNHPLLYSMSQGAKWLHEDSFPAWREWADEVETWFQFLKNREGWDRYLPRLRDDARTRDETLSEIAVAYFLKTRCGLQVLEWEPLGREPKRGEFLVGHDPGPNIFIEVKSPGWEAEIVRRQGQRSPRLKQPKYLAGDGGCTDPVPDVRKAVDKAYPKLPDSIPSMLIVADDLQVALNSWPEVVGNALYCKRAQGYATGYLAEDGCFASQRYEHLGAVGAFNVQLKGSTFEYRFCVFHNPNCLPAVAIPRTVFADYHQCDEF